MVRKVNTKLLSDGELYGGDFPERVGGEAAP